MTTPTNKSVAYCEQLGLNTVYEHALSVHKSLDETLSELAVAKDRKRSLESNKSDLEMEVIEDERSTHPEMSAAQMEKHLKVAFSNNTDIRETRDLITACISQIEGLEYDVDIAHVSIKIDIARLHELDGYFTFMSVIKSIEEARKRQETPRKEPGDPW